MPRAIQAHPNDAHMVMGAARTLGQGADADTATAHYGQSRSVSDQKSITFLFVKINN